jgi:hypothetical protein
MDSLVVSGKKLKNVSYGDIAVNETGSNGEK